jgi:N-acetyl-anhydromuramyl-L-alanine amidase AmpD
VVYRSSRTTRKEKSQVTTNSQEHDDLCLADIPESERPSPTRELEATLARDAGTERGAAGMRFLVRTDVRSHNHGNFAGLPQRMVDPPRGIMLHHTAGRKAGDLATLVNPGTGVSANDYVTKEPVIYELCPHPRRAWHAGVPGAGVSYASDGNTNYWGVEIENLGDGADPYPAAQIDALVWRCRQLRRRWPNIDEPSQLFRHRDYAPGRKTDPSDNFPFERVRRRVLAASDKTDG